MALLAAVEVGLVSVEKTVPTFDLYRITEPKFSGKPMQPVIKTAEDRRFRCRNRFHLPGTVSNPELGNAEIRGKYAANDD